MDEEKLERYIKIFSIPIFTLALVTLAVINLSKTDINWWIFFLIEIPFLFVSIWIYKSCLRWLVKEIHATDSLDYDIKVIDIKLLASNLKDANFRIFYDTKGKVLKVFRIKFYEVQAPSESTLQEFYDTCDLDETKLNLLISNLIKNDGIY